MCAVASVSPVTSPLRSAGSPVKRGASGGGLSVVEEVPEDADRDLAARVDQLQRALASREVIGQALGILMSRDGVSADEAFERLRVTSQDRNQKLRDVAAIVVDGSSSGVVGVDRVEQVLEVREVVARAQGILMERHRLTAAAAEAWLRTAADRAGRSVSGVAGELVESGAEPDAEGEVC